MSDSKWEFKDNTLKVLAAMDDKMQAVVEECAGELESQTKRNSRVAAKHGGKTKNSFQHHVEVDNHCIVAAIGSPEQNAIWEEFGTGEHALKGNGRKGGWSYKDEEGEWHHTYGKTPSRAFWKAYTKLKNKIINRIQRSLKGL